MEIDNLLFVDLSDDGKMVLLVFHLPFQGCKFFILKKLLAFSKSFFNTLEVFVGQNRIKFVQSKFVIRWGNLWKTCIYKTQNR